MPYRRFILFGLLLTLGFLSGCEGWGGSQETAQEDSEYSIDDEESAGEEKSGKEKVAEVDEDASDELDKPEKGATADATRQSLQLNLKVGDRFPLIKSVTQTLYQDLEGKRSRSQSTLELTMSLAVEDYKPVTGDRKFGVKYHRVKYQQDLLGKSFQFDSQAPSANAPQEALAFQGLIENGFSFWIGKNNQVSRLERFDSFLDQCLARLPAEHRPILRSQLNASSGAEGIANFVDDTIGLLPPTAVKVGDHWSLTRQSQHPIPMQVMTRYTLENISDQLAEVRILGSVANSAPRPASTEGLSVTVRGGQQYGSCTIDRRTGLPINSQINQEIAMKVRLPNKKEFDQRKQTITIIRAYPAQGTSVTFTPPKADQPEERGALEQPIRQVSATEAPSGQVRHAVDTKSKPVVEQAVGKKPAEANPFEDADDLEQGIQVKP